MVAFFNILILVLSIYVLSALLVDTVFKLPSETSRLLRFIDHIIYGFFLLDFIIRFRQAANKWKFMQWGWIDLLSSIPAINVLRAGRTLRLIRLLRILRAFRSTSHIIKYVFRHKRQGTFTTVAIIAILMVIFSAIAILQVRQILTVILKQQKMLFGGPM